MFSYLTLVIIFSFLYVLGITFLYFSKTHVNNVENALYKILIITNLAGLVLQFLCDMVSYVPDALNSFLPLLVLRLYLIYFIFWFGLILIYVIQISFKTKKVATLSVLIICVIMSIAVSILPMSLHTDTASKIFYTYGPAVDVTFLCSGLIGIILFFSLIIKRKYIPTKKATPLYIFLACGLIAAVIQRVRPELVILTCVESFICGMMYFTIENPDLKIIDELETNRRIVDQNNEAKSNLLFKLSQELRHPLKEIVDLSDEMANSDNETMRKLAAIINQNAGKMYSFVNNVLDITSLDASKIKTYETKYNIRNLMDEVVMLCRSKVKSGVDFQYDISLSVPEILYGDKIKIKQIIYSLLCNVLDYTDSGFVSLSLEAINKYDMSRLVFVIEDSGAILNVSEVNNILSYDEPLTDSDLQKLEKSVIELPLINKLVKSYDGNMIIKSLANKGNSYTISIDQKSDDVKLITEYINREFKRVLIVSNNDYLLDKLSKLLKKHFVVISKSMYADDALDRFKNDEVIDYVIVDSEIKDTNVVELQKNIREICKYDLKIFVIMPFYQEKIKDKYKKSGFDDYLLFSDINNEVERITKDLH